MPPKPNHRPLLLLILDGWGYSENPAHNAISQADTPTWDYLWSHYPHTLLSASGTEVGLPQGQMGNSEVGHLNMGAGRVIFQELPRIDSSIESGDFFKNPILCQTMQDLAQSGKALHLMGLLSPGGVHSHEKHLFALLALAQRYSLKEVYIHVFLDGRDTPPRSAETSLQALESVCKTLQCGRVASLSGRYYAMDRDHRWDRTAQVYQLLTHQHAAFYADDALSALHAAYQRNENDEFVQPTLIRPAVSIQDGDAVIFFNFRADRARQLSHAFLDPTFIHFQRQTLPRLSHFVSMTPYAKNIPSEVAFLPLPLNQMLGEYLSSHGLTQLRIAETEKYAHVTFFFNGGRETPFEGEDRILIASPKVATYDLQPEMSAIELTARLQEAILSKKYDFIVCNYANPDMLGHTGDYSATLKAIETIDQCLKKIYDTLRAADGEMVITADHGNAECMFDDKTQQPHTAHTQEPVPFIYVGRPATCSKKHGILADIAPTLLYLLGLAQPTEMTGQPLLKLEKTFTS
ncbi:MAG: 2,3-bisphosphoglycerate-independent phosphoglycerate mutase [Gammaproteobacteria bacterium]|nr:2,3-bisphosphoglycerate-independent phosphoglycerate mutase [Gammaproteobacteria bacterium]